MYRELLDRWCKANPGFYKSTYSFLGLEECKKAGFSMKEGDYLLAVVYVDRSVNWHGLEYEGIKGETDVNVLAVDNETIKTINSLLKCKLVNKLVKKLAKHSAI